MHDPETRLGHPPEHPDHDFLRDMMIVVHYREDYLKDHLSRDTMEGHMISIEQELLEHNIYYQSISIRDSDAI